VPHAGGLQPGEAAGPDLDRDRAKGVIRSKEHAFSKDGGLAVLYGNLAEKGCIVKTAGVDESILKFTGRGRACSKARTTRRHAILNNKIVAGRCRRDPLRRPEGGPGMQEMLYPTTLPEVARASARRARCSPMAASRAAPSGLSIGHASPEAAEGGLDRAGGRGRHGSRSTSRNGSIHLAVPGRRAGAAAQAEEARGKDACAPHNRKRVVSAALQAYARAGRVGGHGRGARPLDRSGSDPPLGLGPASCKKQSRGNRTRGGHG